MNLKWHLTRDGLVHPVEDYDVRSAAARLVPFRTIPIGFKVMLVNSLAILIPAIHHYNSIFIIGLFTEEGEPTILILVINDRE